MRASFDESHQRYGSPRIHEDLIEQEERVSRKRVIRLMQEDGLEARARKRFKCTTMSDHDQPVAANLLDRCFEAPGPNQRWVGDTTEFVIGSSDVYDPPLSFYNTSLDDDLSDTVLAGHLHAGADVRIADRTWLGLKMTCSMLDDIETRGGYELHAAHALDPDFEYHDTFAAARSWTLMFTGKYAFDN